MTVSVGTIVLIITVVVFSSLVVTAIALWRYVRSRQELSSALTTRIVVEICKRYSINFEYMNDGTLRLYRNKGGKLLWEQYFATLDELKKEFRFEWRRIQ